MHQYHTLVVGKKHPQNIAIEEGANQDEDIQEHRARHYCVRVATKDGGMKDMINNGFGLFEIRIIVK